MENNFNPSLKENFSEEIQYAEKKKRFSSSDKKGILLIVVLIVVAVLMTFAVKGSVDKKAPADATTASEAVQTTQAPVTSAAPQTTLTTNPVTEKATTDVPSAVITEKSEQTTAAPIQQTEAQTTEKTGYTDEEILKTIGDGINALKASDASFKAHKTQVISITLLDCSVPALTSTINFVLDYFAGEKTADYDVTNGKATDADGEEIVVNHEIPPTDKPFTLTMDGVAQAKTEKTDKGTVFSVKVVPETSTLENPRPPYHNAACDTLDFSAFELPVGEITKCDFTYPGATVSVTVDDNGKIVEYRERLEMSGTGEGNALGISGSGTMEGYVDEVWAIEWK